MHEVPPPLRPPLNCSYFCRMAKNKHTPLRVVELFAGVGGFRLGLEGVPNRDRPSKFSKPGKSKYEVIWSNQWEPSTKTQHASMVYENIWGKKNHSNKDIAEVPTDEIPDCDVLVGGFPCQDYSVATTLKNSKGIIGKKGVLWWEIYRILKEKKNKPKYLILENVDRLLKSPAKQRGRDFAIMLKCLNELEYAVEWRIINAAEYGMPQRRRRVFILGYKKGTGVYSDIKKSENIWLEKNGILARAFPISMSEKNKSNFFSIEKETLKEISDEFNLNQKLSPFFNSGVMINGGVFTQKTEVEYSGPQTNLSDIIIKEKVAPGFYISEKDLPRWQYLKGAKKETRRTKDGFEYQYAEGGMIFPDALGSPSRTIITGEGGASPSRFKHVIKTKHGLRRLTPVELERLNMFPDNHTKMEGITDAKRAFFMGNALVVGVVQKIGGELFKFVENE